MKFRTIIVVVCVVALFSAAVVYVAILAPRPDTSGLISSAERPLHKKTLDGFNDSLEDAEQAYSEAEMLKSRLVEQGYSEEVVDELLAGGAQSAVQLPYIAAVKEKYGHPWNLPLVVGEFTLVDLYVVGNKFVLGYYEDATGERVIWIHMSVTESYDYLQAGLRYTRYRESEYHTEYLDDSNNTVGFAFWVESADEKIFSRYVATASFSISSSVINDFTGSVVDGVIGVTGKEPK